MAYESCENCGCRVYRGICVNCNEELWIEEEQGEYLDARSDEWNEKVAKDSIEQRARLTQEPQP